MSRLKNKFANPNTIFCIANEMIPNHGEDSYYYSTTERGWIAAAFDGCGGIGSHRYASYGDKTGAYVASRAVCGAVKNWFENSEMSQSELEDYIRKALDVCTEFSGHGASRFKGSLQKEFPTTAAIITVNNNNGEAYTYWAGDSRCYILDSTGLHQISRDDLEASDALSNLSDDGAMTNVINSTVPFLLHCKKVCPVEPTIFISSSDGCFSYMPTPMEFEFLLLDTLVNAQSLAEWKGRLCEAIASFAGDDYTLCVSVCGFSDFASIKKRFAERHKYMMENYIAQLSVPNTDVNYLWNVYKTKYYI